MIVRLMLTLQWQRGKTGRQLAKLWPDVKLPTIRRLASEASALADMVTGQRKQLVELGRAELANIGLEGENDQARIAAWRTLFEHLGELRQRHLVTPARDPLAELTDEELEHYAATGKMPARLKGGNEP